MENVSNKYQYLSGDTKRNLYEFETQSKFRELQRDTDKRFDDLAKELKEDEIRSKIIVEIEEETLNNSVKPGVKTKYNKRKLEGKKKFIAYAIGAGLIFTAGGITIHNGIEWIQNVKIEWEANKYLNDEINDFKKDVISPNTTIKFASNQVEGTEIEETKTIHYHDMSDIMAGVQTRTNDPTVAYYLLYQGMDSWCLEQGDVLRAYNSTYGTNYESHEDFLLKNGFKDMKELKMYAAEALRAEEEAILNGSSNARG